MYRIDNIKVPLGREITADDIAKKASIGREHIKSYKIRRKSVDARRKSNVHYVFCTDVETDVKLCGFDEVTEENYIFPTGKPRENRPVVVGAGPCGLFAALMLSNGGYRPILIERGTDVDTRKTAVERYWKTGFLDTETNVQFGEGGAGTFSDGKLNSGIHDKRCRFVLENFVKFGADERIVYEAKPHIGTDVLSKVVKNMRMEIEKNGGEVRFLNKLSGIETKNGAVSAVMVDFPDGRYRLETDAVLLAVGHSARDTYSMIKKLGAKMEQKSFSVGARIEHRQSLINKSQYGDFADALEAADYKLSVHYAGGRSAYTFCMCPGGSVVASASEIGTIVTNGMSFSARDGENANSALLVNVTPSDFASDDPLAGVYFQETIEKKAFIAGGNNGNAPAEYLSDFLGTKPDKKVKPTYLPGVTFCNIEKIFPDFVTETMKRAIFDFDRKIKGFADGGAVLTAPETRSSAPVRILRDKESFMSNIKGLYPCGEGAGYAGGIMSAAVDGIKVSEIIAGGKN
ncbi:MAG: hypothetical protein PUB42_04280 [Firmicutes bacterium]|nr:hypothetical protein [Bacillota bacterium]